MSPSLARQAESLYDVFSELVRGYQFRDREGICCHGLSVSQCYTLDALVRHGPASMGELADHLYLEVSTMTRVVDHSAVGFVANRACTHIFNEEADVDALVAAVAAAAAAGLTGSPPPAA